MSQLIPSSTPKHNSYIHFLNESEIRYYFSLPNFTAEDRIYFFGISDTERDYFKSLLSDHSKLYYVLLAGYYKATNSVFTLSNIHVPNKDISYVCEKYHLSVDKFSLGRNAISKHKNYMCEAYKFNIYTSFSYRKRLVDQASISVKIHIKPLYIFGELCRYLKDNSICMPSYPEFQKVISKALSLEQQRLQKKLAKLPENIDKYLEHIVQNTETLNLSSIIKQPQATTNQEINDELKRLASINETYEHSTNFISSLSISSESVKHYSSLVTYYGRGRLARMQDPLVKLYIICYINHRFHKINDHLANSFRSITSKYYTEACNTAKDSWAGAEETYRQKRQDIANVLSMHYEDQGLDDQKFSKVKQASHKLVSVKDMKRAVTYMRQEDNRKNKLIWKAIGKCQSRYKKNIRKIFLHLDITSSDRHLLKAIKFVKANIKTKEPIEYRLYPKGIIPGYLRNILITRTKKKRQMNFAQYEFLVYWVLSEYLKDGDAYIKNSI